MAEALSQLTNEDRIGKARAEEEQRKTFGRGSEVDVGSEAGKGEGAGENMRRNTLYFSVFWALDPIYRLLLRAG